MQWCVCLCLPQLGVCRSMPWRSQQTKFPNSHIKHSQSQLTSGSSVAALPGEALWMEDGLGTMQITSSDGEARNVILGISSSPGKAGSSLSVSGMGMEFHCNSTLQRDFHRKEKIQVNHTLVLRVERKWRFQHKWNKHVLTLQSLTACSRWPDHENITAVSIL
jgi:hypothetical protein